MGKPIYPPREMKPSRLERHVVGGVILAAKVAMAAKVVAIVVGLGLLLLAL